jgi:hypothetical protein
MIFLLQSLKIYLKKIPQRNLFMIEKTLKNQEKVSQDHLLFILKKRKHKIIKKSKFNKKIKA